VKAFAQSRLSRTKTDGQDALIIARYALELFRDDAFRPWEPERAEVAQLRQLVARREQLLETRTAAQNRLQALKEDGDSLAFSIAI
jgi:transposase